MVACTFMLVHMPHKSRDFPCLCSSMHLKNTRWGSVELTHKAIRGYYDDMYLSMFWKSCLTRDDNGDQKQFHWVSMAGLPCSENSQVFVGLSRPAVTNSFTLWNNAKSISKQYEQHSIPSMLLVSHSAPSPGDLMLRCVPSSGQQPRSSLFLVLLFLGAWGSTLLWSKRFCSY